MRLRSWILGLAATLAATAANAADYYSNVNAWPVSPDFGFTISAPIDFEGMGAPQDAPDWRWNSSDPGKVLYEIIVPRAIEPQTNLGGATITIGMSSNPKAVANCLAPAGAPPDEKSWKQKIGGVEFSAFRDSDDGMSHYHEITSYRAVHAGQCWAVEYMIASTSLGVYPPEYGLKPFDMKRVRELLDRIVATFKFG